MRLSLTTSGCFLLVISLAAACGTSMSPPLDSAVTGGASSGGSGGAPASGGTGGVASGGGPSGGGASGGQASGGGPSGGAPSQAGMLHDFLGQEADDFWQTASFDEAGMVAAPIAQAIAEIEASELEVHSFLVARRGKLVVDQYGWDTGTNPAVPSVPHQLVPLERRPLFSTTKSILSALFGIAIEQGVIGSLDETVASYFDDYAELNPSAAKDSIDLEDLLTMRSGLEWTEGDQTTFEAPDPARAMLSRPVVDEVGVDWNYSSGVSDIVAAILRTTTGQTPLDFANEFLFGPLGVDSPAWEAAENGTQYGGWGLSLTPREMARFGELYRNQGEWLGEPVVPAAWTDSSTEPRCTTPWGGQYGYHFWVPDMADGSSFFSTLGAFGQLIYVSRELELVVVFTANIPSEVADSTLRALITDYVVPAIVN
jgi:CubicO group peptidase (beta-lactamase class C family)